MGKRGFLLIFLLIFLFATVALSQESELNEESQKVDLAFKCLINRTGNSCQNVNTIQDLSLVILTNADNVESCVSKLEQNLSKGLNSHRVRDVALATLALNNRGKSTNTLKNWLKNRTIVPDNIYWFIQQDSDKETKCTIKYDNLVDEFSVGPTKKITLSKKSSCFEVYKSYFLKVDPTCYGKTFEFNCLEDYTISVMYSDNINSNPLSTNTIYLQDKSKFSSAYSAVRVSVNSKCFPNKVGINTCSYEDSLWATYALSELSEDVRDLFPYLSSASSLASSKSYLPNAFLSIFSGANSVFETELYGEQREDGSWIAPNTAYDKFYDSALALLSLGIKTEQTKKTENWLWFNQEDNGCWGGNNIRDTSMILWSVVRKENSTGVFETAYCEAAGYACVPESLCSVENNLGTDFFCSGVGITCCKEPIKNTCAKMGGEKCATGYTCSGTKAVASDTPDCCLGTCTSLIPDIDDDKSECEEAGHICLSSCSTGEYERVSYECSGTKMCCKRIYANTPNEEVPLWIWIMVAILVAGVIVIIFIYKEKIKMLLFKSKVKSNASKSPQPGGSPVPPYGRPPYPPRRPPYPPRNYGTLRRDLK